MLTELDKAVLFTIYKRANKSKKAHFSIEFICKGFPTNQHGFIKRSVEKLRKIGLLYIKPHPSGRSYGLTDEGWELARKLEEKCKTKL